MTNSTSDPTFLRRPMDATRILVFGGILLILLGMVLGEVFAIFISHVANGEIKQQLFAVAEAVGNRDPDSVQTAFDTIEALQVKRGRIMNTHSHIIAYGYLALTLALLQPFLSFSEKRKRLLALALIAGSFLQTIFIFASPYTGSWSLLLSDLGALLVIAGVGGNLLGLLRMPSGADGLKERILKLLDNRSSRLLLRGGGILILVGMVFGFYYAWVFVTQYEVQQWEFMDSVMTNAQANKIEEAIAAVNGYRGMQSKIAITAAAHSHAIEVGMMALLLAFIQNFIFLDERWKLRWAWVFSVGAFGTPTAIFNATIFGLVAAAFADLSGFLMILALSAMLFGVIRNTGGQDAQSLQGGVR